VDENTTTSPSAEMLGATLGFHHSSLGDLLMRDTHPDI
jgi:hypothetical protein